MTHRRLAAVLLVAALVVTAMALPAAAIDLAPDATPTSTDQSESTPTTMAVANNSSNGSVNVSVGQQLSTVISVTSDEVETDVEETAFELEYEDATESGKAEALADRAGALQDRVEEIRADYEAATEAYREGDLTRDQYAQRLATLNARASNVLESAERLRANAQNVSALELQAAGLSSNDLSTLAENLSSVTGAGATALFHRFTGETEGEIELETENGLQIEVESEDGEVSRELTRDRDDDQNITISQSAALDTARGVLSTPDQGAWTLQKASIHPDSGYYTFEFALTGTNETIGEAEVRVDGSTGDVFRVEAELVPVGDDDDERDGAERDQGDEAEGDEGDERDGEDGRDGDDDRGGGEDDELVLIVTDGTPSAGETITVKAIADGEAVPNATVTLNGAVLGTTGADGALTVTLPDAGAVEFAATSGDADGELEFDLGEDEAAAYSRLQTNARVTNNTVTLTVTYDGAPVTGATITGNDEVVGTTDASGTVTFATPTGDELEVEVTKGEFEADVTYTIQNGELTKTDDVGDRDDEDDGADEGEQGTEDETDDADDSTDDETDETDDSSDDSSGDDSSDGGSDDDSTAEQAGGDSTSDGL